MTRSKCLSPAKSERVLAQIVTSPRPRQARRSRPRIVLQEQKGLNPVIGVPKNDRRVNGGKSPPFSNRSADWTVEPGTAK